MKVTPIIGALALLGIVSPALGHHSFSMFDANQTVDVTGTVKSFEWANPHVWIELVVPEAGNDAVYRFEAQSPNNLSPGGWRSTSVHPGDKITVTMHPLKDGEKGGQLLGAILADGTALGRGTGPNGIAAPPPGAPGGPAAGGR